MVTFTASGVRPDGRYTRIEEGTATAIFARVDELHSQGVIPVRIRQDGRLIETSEELDGLLKAEREAFDAHRT